MRIAAEQGDYSGIALLSASYNLVVPSLFSWGDLASKAVSADYDPNRNYLSVDKESNSIIVSPVSTLLRTASAWPIETIPEEYRLAQETDVETLLVSGSIDFSTPAEYATAELLPYLNNGQQVVLDEMGHVDDIFGEQNEARLRLFTSFYDTGIADDSLYVYAPMNFEVKLSLQLIAKIIVVVLFIIILLILLIVFKVIRKRGKEVSSRNND